MATPVLRSDARRNRARIVSAARALFAGEGVDVPVEDVTQRARVGMGTLYRHFATKDELIDAVLEDAFDEYLGLAESALEEADAWTGLELFLRRALELQVANHGLKDVVARREHGRRRAQAMRRRLKPLLERLVERVHADRSLRGNLSAEDVLLVLWGGGGVIDRAGRDAPRALGRYVDLSLAGLRSER